MQNICQFDDEKDILMDSLKEELKGITILRHHSDELYCHKGDMRTLEIERRVLRTISFIEKEVTGKRKCCGCL